MVDIFDEIEEEVRKDKATAFFYRHGMKIMAAFVIMLLSVAAWRFYQDSQYQNRIQMSTTFNRALEISEGGNDGDLSSIADNKNGIYPVLARFKLASVLAKKAKDDEGRKDAISAYDTLSNDAKIEREWRDYAKIQAAFIMIDYAPYEEIEKRLLPLTEIDGIYRASAQEGIALAAWKAGLSEKASDALQAILIYPSTPRDLKERAEILFALVRAGVPYTASDRKVD